MMKMSGRVMSCCVALILVLTSVSAVQRDLNSIDDLKQINFAFGHRLASLRLLYWFANAVEINENNIIWLTFDPNRGDYGSHHYGNFEGLLDPLHRGSGHQYYTIGNLYQEASMRLPLYVVQPPRREYEGTNSHRIIIRAREQNTGGRASQRIDQVYITQHIEQQGEYDPNHTYRITTNLLRQIREFSVGQNQQQLSQLRNRYGSDADVVTLRNTWGDLAGLGLLLSIVINGRYFFNEEMFTPQRNYTSHNRQNDWDEALMILVVFVVVVFVLAFLSVINIV